MSRAGLLFFLFLGGLCLPGLCQEDPALQVASQRLVEAYLRAGPTKEELPDGSATANWAIMKKVGLPELLLQEPLRVGSWPIIWAPVRSELDKRGFPKLEPLEVLSWWEDTRKEPQRFLRLLVQNGMLDARVPRDREKGAALRDALTVAAAKIEEIRANVRFERAGWSFTGTASLVPGQRVVRLALRGSQPCPGSGTARTANVALKGRIYQDKTAREGIKIQLLENQFSSTGCEDTLKMQISTMAAMAAGGEVRANGGLVLQIRDETITGRLQLDLSYRPAGEALQTGHGTYALRGSVSPDGTAHATLTPVSTSGSKMFRAALNKAGALEGQVKQGQGAGGISMPIFKQPLSWRATRG